MATLLRGFIRIAGLLLILILLYLAAAFGLSTISVKPQHNGNDITLYLISNGVHVDIAMPLQNEVFDWTTLVSPTDTLSGSPNARYLAIGWGERNFYLNTPTWSDLTASTALQALSGMNQTLMHVSFYPAIQENERIVRFAVSREQYRQLSQHIQQQFVLSNQRAIALPNVHYHQNDAFYPAHGRYHLFNTCNSWVNRQLKNSQIEAIVWTPFAHHLLDIYR